MPTYRLYQLNDEGHIDRAPLVLVLEDDDAAVSRAKQMVGGHDVEVWQRDRRVTVIKSPEKHRGSEAAH